MKKLFAALILCGCGSASAAPITIDFDFVNDDVGSGGPLTLMPAYGEEFRSAVALSSDFYFSFTSGDGLIVASGANSNYGGAGSNGTGYLTTLFASELFFARLSGGTFDLQSLVVSDATRIVGQKANGDLITMFPSLTPGTWSTLDFGDEWSDLVRVSLGGGSVGANFVPAGNLNLDSVVVNVVPIPAAVWLFGSALAGLGWLIRKPIV